jgi:hypothetical protein
MVTSSRAFAPMTTSMHLVPWHASSDMTQNPLLSAAKVSSILTAKARSCSVSTMMRNLLDAQAMPAVDCTVMPEWTLAEGFSPRGEATDTNAALPIDYFGPQSICMGTSTSPLCWPSDCQRGQVVVQSRDQWVSCPEGQYVAVRSADMEVLFRCPVSLPLSTYR